MCAFEFASVSDKGVDQEDESVGDDDQEDEGASDDQEDEGGSDEGTSDEGTSDEGASDDQEDDGASDYDDQKDEGASDDGVSAEDASDDHEDEGAQSSGTKRKRTPYDDTLIAHLATKKLLFGGNSRTNEVYKNTQPSFAQVYDTNPTFFLCAQRAADNLELEFYRQNARDYVSFVNRIHEWEKAMASTPLQL